MRAASLALLAVLAGCPSEEGNPSTLWLAPDGSEVKLKLQDEAPPPW